MRRSGARRAAATTPSRSTPRSERVDSLTSNIGHLLWSGIVPAERVDVIVDQLMGEELWSGWGVRTMSAGDGGYNPLAYHNGTVWPHDNSLIASGLARYGRWPEALRIVRRLLNASSYFDHQLPEVFAGFSRTDDAVPDPVPDRRAPAGLGRRCAGAAPPAPARAAAGPAAARARHDRPGRHSLLGRRASPHRGARVRQEPGTCNSRTGVSRSNRREDRNPLPGVVPGPAVGLRRDRVGRLAARRRPGRGRPRRHALRLGRLLHEGEARLRLSGGAVGRDRQVRH